MDIILLIWNIKNCNSNLAAHLHCKPPFCSQNPFIEALMGTCSLQCMAPMRDCKS